MRRASAMLMAAVLIVGLAEASATGMASAAPAPKAASGYTPPPIAWGECDDPTLLAFGAQCGDLVVPMDYAHPRGTKITLAVSRVLHTTPANKYQGVMLVNPGGPGGSGRIYSILQTFVPDAAGEAYDWIGFDPRGVGSSRPSLSCDSTVFAGDRPPYVPLTKSILSSWVKRSRDYARACVNSPGSALFQHVKTTDSVADMESLRKALHQKQINYYGFSYGTYLGSVYATLHPDRVRRFVFDGTVNPDRVWYRANQDQDIAFEKTSKIYFTWLARYHDIYHVGNTPAQVRAGFYATVRKLDRHAEQGILGGDELTDVFTSPAYYVFGWEDVAQAYSAYLNQGDPSGLIDLYTGANDTSPGGDNAYALYLGTVCTDARWPRSQARLNVDNWRLYQRYKFLTWSNAWFNGPCAYWHYPASQPVRVTGSHVTSPILMIGETFDAATPFSGSLRIRQLFPTASLIEGKDGSTHAGSLSGVACTDDSIARYLKDGTVPTRLAGNRSDRICPPVPQPVPTAAVAKSSPSTADGTRAAALTRLHAGILDADLHR